MFNKTDLLRFAFEEATNAVNVNSVDEKIAESVIKTGMRAYAHREGFEFSEREIKETIREGLGTLKEAGADFRFQTKMMN